MEDKIKRIVQFPFFWFLFGFAGLIFQPHPLLGIEIQPSSKEVETAIQKGKELTVLQPQFPNRFGTGASCGFGYVQTKLFALWMESQRAAKEFRTLTPEAINRTLETEEMTIMYSLCSDDPKDLDHKMFLLQNGKKIEPSRTLVNFPDIISTQQPQAPAYSITLRANFPFHSFDPMAQTTVEIVSPSGKSIKHTLDFSKFP